MLEGMTEQLSKGCNCNSCLEKARKNYAYFEKYQDRAEEVFSKYVINGKFEETNHGKKRNLERCMNFFKAQQLIRKGSPINFGESKYLGEANFTLLTHEKKRYTKNGKEVIEYMPYHFVISYSFKTGVSTIVSFYRPNHEKWSWKWDDTYQYQIYHHTKERDMYEKKFVEKNWEVI